VPDRRRGSGFEAGYKEQRLVISVHAEIFWLPIWSVKTPGKRKGSPSLSNRVNEGVLFIDCGDLPLRFARSLVSVNRVVPIMVISAIYRVGAHWPKMKSAWWSVWLAGRPVALI
jgi:hypothetical protein